MTPTNQQGKRKVIKVYVVLFKHSNGWTPNGACFKRSHALSAMQRQKRDCPDFKYKIVRTEIII